MRTGLKNQKYPAQSLKTFRKAAGLSLRALAGSCIPPLNPATISRIEDGGGYTGETLSRVAQVLNLSGPEAFFYPDELSAYAQLDNESKVMIQDIIKAKLAEAELKKIRSTERTTVTS